MPVSVGATTAYCSRMTYRHIDVDARQSESVGVVGVVLRHDHADSVIR